LSNVGSNFALPDYDDSPASRFERPTRQFIPALVARELVFPKRNVGFRSRPPALRTIVPKAAVNQHDDLPPYVGDIRASAFDASVNPIAS